MKRGTLNHTKMRRLKRALNLRLYEAAGLLEALWHLTGNERPTGDIGTLSDSDIADALEWGGDPGQLIAALVETGWLDKCQRCRLVVHDWKEHCDDAVRKRVQRSGLQWATPMAEPADSGRPRRTTADNGSLPKPEPEPDPEPTPTARPVPADGGGDLASVLRQSNGDEIGEVMRLAMDAGFSLSDSTRLARMPGATVERVRWLLSRQFPPGRREASVFKGVRDEWDVPREPSVADQAAEKAKRVAALVAASKGARA